MRKDVIEFKVPFFSCNINTTEFVFASDILAFPILIQISGHM